MIDMILPLYTSDSAYAHVERSIPKTRVQMWNVDCAEGHPKTESGSPCVSNDCNSTGIWVKNNEEHVEACDGTSSRKRVSAPTEQSGIEQGSLLCCSNQAVMQSSLLKNISDCNFKAVKHLLQTGTGAGQHLSPWLFVAAKAGSVEIFKLLVNCGFNPNKRLQFGQAPMHYAAYYGNVSIVQFLIRSGQSVDLKDTLSNTPIHYAVDTRRDNRNMIEFLVQNHKNEKMATDFLNTTSDTGSAPLLIAIWRRNFQHVKCLCELGAIPTYSDCRMAVLKHDVKILMYLLQRNAPLTEQRNTSITAGSEIERHNNEQIYISRGEDSLLHLACAIENPQLRFQMVHILLANGYEIRRDFRWICDTRMAVFQKHEGKTLHNYLRTRASSVRPLTYLASIRIRQHIGPSLLTDVHRLPVPELIKDLIKLTDHGVSCYRLQDTTLLPEAPHI